MQTDEHTYIKNLNPSVKTMCSCQYLTAIQHLRVLLSSFCFWLTSMTNRLTLSSFAQSPGMYPISQLHGPPSWLQPTIPPMPADLWSWPWGLNPWPATHTSCVGRICGSTEYLDPVLWSSFTAKYASHVHQIPGLDPAGVFGCISWILGPSTLTKPAESLATINGKA
jgi:hypothetical protein